MEDPLEGYLSIPEAAHYLRHHTRTVQRWADLGTLEHVRLGRKVWFPPESIVEVLGGTPENSSAKSDLSAPTVFAPKSTDSGGEISACDILDNLLTVEETAFVLRHAVTTIQKWVKERKLRCRWVSRDAYFDPADIRNLIELGRRKRGLLLGDRRHPGPSAHSFDL